MKSIRVFLHNLHQDESGQDLIEYALIAALLALAAITTISSLGVTINSAFSTIGSHLTSAFG